MAPHNLNSLTGFFDRAIGSRLAGVRAAPSGGF